VTQLYKNVPVLDSGARGATTTFVERGIGDVLVAWENEALLGIKALGPGKFEIVNPTISIVAEPPVAVVDKYAEKHGTTAVAEAYLKYLYSPEGQALAAKHYFRAADPDSAAKNSAQFPTIELFGLAQYFSDWAKAQEIHFKDNGEFDRIFSAAKK
jgi:sulfate transport system substrate-binding protein